MAYLLSLLFLTLISLNTLAIAKEGGDVGDMAPEFPSGKFSDGRQYHLSDFRGKILVLFFYEQQCPTCRGTIPARNSIVNRYSGQPVQFIGVGAGDSLEDVSAYVSQTQLAMPVFADSHSKMERSYGINISLHNIYQSRVIGPDGHVVGYDMEPATIDQALSLVSLSNHNSNVNADQQNLSGWQTNVEGTPNDGGNSVMQQPYQPNAMAAQFNGGGTVMQQPYQPNAMAPQPNGGGTVMQQLSNTSAPTVAPSSSQSVDPVRINDEAVKAINNRNYPEAIKMLKALITVDPSYKIALNNLGIAYTDYGILLAKQGKLVQAKAAMKEALEMAQKMYAPDDPRVINRRQYYTGIVKRLGQVKPQHH